MTIQNAYNTWSVTYDTDRNLTRDLDQTATRETLASLPATTILELGCGTGKNTAYLAQIGQYVHALDFSEGMIQHAKAKITADNVTFATADLTQRWNLPDNFADLVVCNLVLEHIENIDFVFAEAARTLQPGGHFFLCELHPFRQYQGSKANFQREDETTEIPAHLHHLTDFLTAAESSGLSLRNLKEWWHEEDQNKPPRLVSFLFTK